MKNLKSSFLIIILGVGLIGLALWLTRNRQNVVAAAPSSSTVFSGKDGGPNLPAISTSISSPLKPQENEISLSKKSNLNIKLGPSFQNTTNYRKFIEQSLQHPEFGGNYYAYLALFNCKMIKTTEVITQLQPPYDPLLNHAKAVKQQDSKNRLQAACEGITTDDLDVKNVSKIMQDGWRLGDPLLRDTAEKQAPLNVKEKKELIKAIFDIADSTAFVEADGLVTHLLTRANEQDQALNYYYEGRLLTGREGGTWVHSWPIVSCLMGSDCNSSGVDNRLDYMCVVDGLCFDNRYEFIKAVVFGGDQAAFEQGKKNAESIANNIRKKNYKAFFPE